MSGGVKGGGEVIMSSLNLFHNTVLSVKAALTSDKFVDLLNVYSNLTVYESILTQFQTGELTINDSNDMIPDYPIAGGNIVHIAYNTQDGPEETKRDLWFRVVKAGDLVINERKQGYTLQLISEEGYTNLYTSISSAFHGSPSDIISSIFYSHLYNKDTKNNLMVDATSGGLKFVCPRWKASQAITWVTHKAVSTSDNNPGFFFFQTAKGFRFLSTSMLLNRDKNVVITDIMGDVENERAPEGKVKKGYLFKIPGVPVVGSDGKPISGMVGSETTQNVDDFRVLERNTIAKDVIKGAIASKHITYDIFHKSYTTDTYNYFDDGFSKMTRLSKDIHYAKPPEPPSSDIKVYLSPKHSRIHSNQKGQLGFRTVFADDYGLYRHQIMNQIDDEVVSNFEVPGTSLIEAGRLLEFNYPAIRKVSGPEDVYNKKYSGLYMIRDVIHMFKPVGNQTTSYKVDMNIVKDGWNA